MNLKVVVVATQRTIDVVIDESKTVRDVKDIVAREVDTAVDVQRLLCNGVEMNNAEKLSTFNIPSNRTLFMVRKPDYLSVTVRPAGGSPFTLDMLPGDKIVDLKREIRRKLNSSGSSDMNVKYNGRYQRDGRTLLECNIGNGAVVIYEHRLSADVYITVKKDNRDQTLTVRTTDAVEDVIKKYKNKFESSLVVADYTLILPDGHRCESAASTVSELCVQQDDTVILTRVEHEFFVTDFDGKTFRISANPSDTVDKVWAIVTDRKGLKEEENHLMYAGKKLELGHLLSEYSVSKDSTLHLVAKLPGGRWQ